MPDPTDADELLRQSRALRTALGTFLTGVTVVTTSDAEGKPRGFTANSFTSVSLDPPLVLVCVDRRALSYEAFTTGRGYAVNILSHEHQEVAELFASKRVDKFDVVSTTVSDLGNRILRDAITWLDCRTTDVTLVGDHALLIGQVEAYGGVGGQPLGFHQGRFLSFKPIESASSPTTGEVDVTWIVEDSRGRVALAHDSAAGLTLPGTRMDAGSLSDDGLAAAAQKRLGASVIVEFLYSIYTDESTARLALTYRGRLAELDYSAGVPCTFVDIDALRWGDLATGVETTVLKRYQTERKVQRFGIYAGTVERGSVATIHELLPGTRAATSPDASESKEKV